MTADVNDDALDLYSSETAFVPSWGISTRSGINNLIRHFAPPPLSGRAAQLPLALLLQAQGEPQNESRIVDLVRSILDFDSPGDIDSSLVAAAKLSRTHPVARIKSGPDAFVVQGLEKWEGRVIDVDGEIFTVDMIPLSGDGPSFHADFPMSLIKDEQVEPGDIVYVTVRNVWEEGSVSPNRTASVKLRRLGVRTREEMAAIEDRAAQEFDEVADYIRW